MGAVPGPEKDQFHSESQAMLSPTNISLPRRHHTVHWTMECQFRRETIRTLRTFRTEMGILLVGIPATGGHRVQDRSWPSSNLALGGRWPYADPEKISNFGESLG